MRSILPILLALALLPACSDDSAGSDGGGGGASSTSSGPTTGGGGAGGTSASTTGAGGAPGTGGAGGGTTGAGGAGGAGGGPALTVAACYADDFVNPSLAIDYDQFGPVVGSHCMGTNHQDITGVERVVFVGDSITVGSPPTLSADFYRSQLADALAQKFGIQAPNGIWKTANYFSGQSTLQESGDFASCAKWGARTDDLALDNTQLEDCLPPSQTDKRTLIVMTAGGNDIASLTQDATDGVPVDQLWASTETFVQNLEDAMAWIYEPGRFPNGVYVVFANMYEFTDGTGEVQSCDVSGLAGFDQPVPAPDLLADMVIWANEQYVRIAVDYGADIIFLLEDFCGHGFERDNPAAPCYRGPGQPAWFDLTCIHPNPEGHEHIKDMFMAVVNE